MDSIVVNSVSCKYKSSAPWILDDLSFSLAADSGITGLLGKNGSGKSTLLDCLSGIVRPQNGRIELMGNVAGTIAAKRITGISFQNPGFPANIKVREVIGSIFTLRGIQVSSSRIKKWAEEFLLADSLHGMATNLSGGRQKMLGNLLAMAWEPSILLLDEPSAGLDFEAREQFWEHLRAAKRRGACVLIASHTFEELETLCDRFLWLHKGRINVNDATNVLQAFQSSLGRGE